MNYRECGFCDIVSLWRKEASDDLTARVWWSADPGYFFVVVSLYWTDDRIQVHSVERVVGKWCIDTEKKKLALSLCGPKCRARWFVNYEIEADLYQTKPWASPMTFLCNQIKLLSKILDTFY